jgi:hypothetical protein
MPPPTHQAKKAVVAYKGVSPMKSLYETPINAPFLASPVYALDALLSGSKQKPSLRINNLRLSLMRMERPRCRPCSCRPGDGIQPLGVQ